MYSTGHNKHSYNCLLDMKQSVIKSSVSNTWRRHQMDTFPRYRPFVRGILRSVRGIHRSLVKSPHKGAWRGALMFSLICAWTNKWANNGDAGHFRRHRAHFVVIVMKLPVVSLYIWSEFGGNALWNYILFSPGIGFNLVGVYFLSVYYPENPFEIVHQMAQICISCLLPHLSDNNDTRQYPEWT